LIDWRSTRRGREKNGLQAIGKSRGGWNTKIPALATGDRRVAACSRLAGNGSDAWTRRLVLETAGPLERTAPLLMDRAYEDYRTWLDGVGTAV
jgi:hypothetical protein